MRKKHIIFASLFSLVSAWLAFAQPNNSVTVTAPSPATGTVQIVASGKSSSIRRLDVSVDGATVKSCYARWCTATWNTFVASNGQHKIQAQALLSGGRSVSSEQVVVAANPDLVPSSLTLGASAVTVGSTTPLKLTVSNRGTATAQSVAVKIELAAAGGTASPVTTLNVGTLAAGASSTVSTTLIAPTVPGTYTIVATATTPDPETSTTNNTTTTTLGVSSPIAIADIVSSSLKLGTATLTTSGTTPLQLTVSNLGTAAARSVSVTITLSAGGTTSQVGSISVGTLAAGASGTFGTTLTAPTLPGTYTVVATATTPDPESSTANNTTTTTLGVSSPSTSSPTSIADLASSSLKLGTSTLTAGRSTPLQMTVSNLGTATAQSVAVTISLAVGGASSQVARMTVGTLAAAASATVATTLVSPTVPGIYTVVATATTPDPEATTANNTTTTTLAVSSSSTTTSGGSSSTSTATCHYYASPNGTGNGLSSSSPFQISSFWAVAAPGKTLCLLDGLYQGAASMIDPGAQVPGLSGTSGNPITIRALNDGAVTIDGQFVPNRYPVRLSGQMFWTIEGINAKNGFDAVIRLFDTGDIILRRVVAWDSNFTAHPGAVLLSWQKTTARGENLVEDCAFFGMGGSTVLHYSDVGSPLGALRLRRVWVRNEGSSTNGSQKEAINPNYWGQRFTCENCLITWLETSYPASFRVTASSGTPTTTDCTPGFSCAPPTTTVNPNCTYSVGADPSGPVSQPGCYEAILRIRGGNNTVDTTNINGSLVYLLPGVTYGTTDTSSADIVRLRTGFTPLTETDRHLRHLLVYVPPGLTRKNGTSVYGTTRAIRADCTNNQAGFTSDAVNITTISGVADFYQGAVSGCSDRGVNSGGWTVSSTDLSNHATSLAGLPSGAQNPFTSTTGANLCKRWENGAVTTTGLWPWPMNERIMAATAAAGAYAGPCLGCTGGRAVRIATDVTADIESILGTIPAQCKD